MANRDTRLARLRVLLLFVITISALSLFVWALAKRSAYPPPAIDGVQKEPSPSTSTPPLPSPVSSVPSGSPSIAAPPDLKTDAGPMPENNHTPFDAKLSPSFVGTLNLIIPVAGVNPNQLLDTFTASRSEGRAHDAIDIMAPAGTPVMAATDGEIVRLFQSERGGMTIYQLSPDKKLMFYYAHLQRYADGVAAGKFARQGEVIAYVGDTGNAGAGNYHLHFSVAILADPNRYWEGKNINPYPLLRK